MNLRALALASVLFLVGFWGTPGAARADPDAIPGVQDFFAGIEVGRARDRTVLDARATLALAISMRERLGLRKNGLAYAFDLQLGSTSSGGFLYAASYRIGPGLRLGDLGQLSVTTGLGFSGITGHRLGFAWTLPTDAYLSAPLPLAHLRLILGATGTWLFTEDSRQHGSPHVAPFDEVTARLGLGGRTWAATLFLTELRSTQLIGLSLGVAENLLELGR